jgi:hypothetical protein
VTSSSQNKDSGDSSSSNFISIDIVPVLSFPLLLFCSVSIAKNKYANPRYETTAISPIYIGDAKSHWNASFGAWQYNVSYRQYIHEDRPV